MKWSRDRWHHRSTAQKHFAFAHNIRYVMLCYHVTLTGQIRVVTPFNVECHAVVDNDMTLIRPLNEGQGDSFWYQSISYIWLLYALNNFCFRTHRLATIHSVQTTDDRRTQIITVWLIDDCRKSYVTDVQFLADRTNGRAYATVLRLSSSVCRLSSV